MKKNLLSLIAILFSGILFSQTIPNGGFENWQVTNYENPQYFFTSNFNNNNESTSPVNAQKTTDAFHGSFAIKLTTVLAGTDTAFAFVADGDPGKNPVKGGVPYTSAQKPTGIRLYYKSNIILGDSALILVVCKKAGATIGFYLYKIGATQTSYTLFSKTFSPALAQTPDSIVFACASSDAFAGVGFPGNMIQIDSVGIVGATQQPPMLNGDFETWQGFTNSILGGWVTEGSDNTIDFRTTDKYSGIYALELQTNVPDFGGSKVNPGNALTGIPQHNLGPKGGTPYSQQIDTLYFYYKYLPADPADSMQISLQFKAGGVQQGGQSKLFGFAGTYTKAAFPLNLFQAPDSVIISMQSSKTWPAPNSYIGSDLKIDNMYFASQKLPLSNFSLPLSGCIGQSVPLTDISNNMASNGSWSWGMGGGNPTSSIVENPTVIYNSAGVKNITMAASNFFGSGSPITKTITIYPLPNVTASSAVVCSGTQATLTADGALSYLWSNGKTTVGISVSPTATTSYSVTGVDSHACSNSYATTVTVPVIPAPDLCMVTVDSGSVNNLIIWDKTPYGSLVDSFIVYRETSTNIYKQIGAVHRDSLSLFKDTVRTKYAPNTGDPNQGTYRYKLQIRDTCGNYGPLGKYHNTIFVLYNGSGQFFWTQKYEIEPNVNPVSNYVLICDSINTNDWFPITSVAGTQSTVSDNVFATNTTKYPNANWRVKTIWGISCTPYAKTAYSTTKSNIKTSASLSSSSGTKEEYLEKEMKMFPNPAGKELNIQYPSGYKNYHLIIYNVLGDVVYDENISGTSTGNIKNTKQLDISRFSTGMYTVSLQTESAKVFKKLVVE